MTSPIDPAVQAALNQLAALNPATATKADFYAIADTLSAAASGPGGFYIRDTLERFPYARRSKHRNCGLAHAALI